MRVSGRALVKSGLSMLVLFLCKVVSSLSLEVSIEPPFSSPERSGLRKVCMQLESQIPSFRCPPEG